MDPVKFLDSLQKKPLAYMYDNEDHSSAGIMYIRDPSSLEKFNQESILFIEKADEFLTEMKVLARFALQYPDDVQYLPVHIPNPDYPVCTYENLEDYPCIFDAAPLGIYLFGQDPYHTKGVIVKGLHNPFSLIDFTKYKFEWKLDEKGRKCPWIYFSQTESYPIFNLMSISANPITPIPIFLFAFVLFSISFNGNRVMSITLSRNWTASLVVFLSFVQSIDPFFTMFERLMLPRLHDS